MPIQSTLQRFHPSGKFLFLLGLFLFFLGIVAIVQVLILLPFADIESINDIDKLTDFSNPNIIKGMKLAQAASAILMFIVPSLVFAYLAHPRPPEGREFERGGTFSYLKMNTGFKMISGIAVVVLVFAAMPLINWTGELNSHLSLPDFMSGIENWMKSSEEKAREITVAFLKMNGIEDLLVNLIVVALLAAVGEELLFRGAMQNVFFEWSKNIHTAVWVTAIIFSAFHMQFYGFLPRMLLGVVLGYLYVWSGSLWLPMLFHFLNNGMAVLFAYFTDKGIISEEAETIGSGESPLYYVFVSVVVSVGLMYFVYKNRNPSPSLPEGESA